MQAVTFPFANPPVAHGPPPSGAAAEQPGGFADLIGALPSQPTKAGAALPASNEEPSLPSEAPLDPAEAASDLAPVPLLADLAAVRIPADAPPDTAGRPLAGARPAPPDAPQGDWESVRLVSPSADMDPDRTASDTRRAAPVLAPSPAVPVAAVGSAEKTPPEPQATAIPSAPAIDSGNSVSVPAQAAPSETQLSAHHPLQIVGANSVALAENRPVETLADLPQGPAGRVANDASVPAYWALRTLPDRHEARPVQTPAGDRVDATPDDPPDGNSSLPGPSPQGSSPPALAPTALPVLPDMRNPVGMHATAHAPPRAPTVLPPTLPADLAAIITSRPGGPVELHLSPEELGRLNLHLVQDGDTLRVTVQVERPETLDLLRRSADVLLQEIRTAGFAGGSLSFANWGGAAPDHPDRRPPPAASGQPAPTGLHPPAPDPGPRPVTGGLDLRL